MKYWTIFPLILLLFSCRREQEETIKTGSYDIQVEDTSRDFQVESYALMIQAPPLGVPEDHTILLMEDFNIDSDIESEQIIITQNKEGKQTLFISDYNDYEYQMIAQEPLLVEKREGLSYGSQDITGNRTEELIITGFTKDDKQTLDVLSPVLNSQGRAWLFDKIFSLAVRGIIEIAREERGPQYFDGSSPGRSFNIISEEELERGETLVRLQQTVYVFQPGSRKYIRAGEEVIEVVTSREGQLADFYNGDLTALYGFLNGAWYRVEDLAGNPETIPDDLIFFDSDEKEVAFITDNIQEIYSWNRTLKSGFRNVRIDTRNALLNTVSRPFNITIDDERTLRISSSGDDSWTGIYKVVEKDIESLLDRQEYIKPIEELTLLGGVFKGDDRDFYIDYPLFTERFVTGEERKGSLVFYDLYGTSILQTIYQKDSGAVDERLVYKVDYTYNSDNFRIIRSLSLQPGQLSVNGFTSGQGQPLYLEQLEVTEEH